MQHKPFYTTRAFYSSIIVLFIGALILTFQVVTVRIKHDTALLLTRDETPVSKWAINTTEYDILKEKLNLPDVAPRETAIVGTVTPGTGEASTTTAAPIATSTTASPAIDILHLTLAVKNGTGIDGLAGVVRTRLTKQGFSDVTATNTKTPQKENIFYAKESVTDAMLATLKTHLPASFADARREPALDGSTFDIEIIIGTPIE